MKISEILEERIGLYLTVSDKSHITYDRISVYLSFTNNDIESEEEVIKHRKYFSEQEATIGKIIEVGDDFVEIELFEIKGSLKKNLKPHLIKSVVFSLNEVTIINLS